MKQAVILLGHGSRMPEASTVVDRLVRLFQTEEPETIFQAAFLEIQSPDLLEALQAVFERGADDVVIVPYFLQVGKHVALHVPALVLEAQTRYPNKTIRLSGHLGFDERIVSVVRDLIREARTAS